MIDSVLLLPTCLGGSPLLAHLIKNGIKVLGALPWMQTLSSGWVSSPVAARWRVMAPTESFPLQRALSSALSQALAHALACAAQRDARRSKMLRSERSKHGESDLPPSSQIC